ncbi:OsmC family protein [bacterium]|nr:OsmC family protein [bacterium]
MEASKKYKSFTYQTQLHWLENRAGKLGSEGKPEFRVASPPEFKGEASVWTPEDLFVAAVDTCTMTTFLAFASRKQLHIVAYSSHAEGLLEFTDGGYQFTKIVIRPEIIVQSSEAIPDVEKLIHDAHDNCLIARSIKPKVTIEPVIRTE